MTLYARSDVLSVALSTSHGGCGAVHSRPVTRGAPSAAWALDCLACEQHLRHDPQWSVTLAEVPETPDEERARELREKHGAQNRETQLVDAILAIAGSQRELPSQLAEALRAAGLRGADGAGDAPTCPAGHVGAPGARFCGECGAPLAAPPAAALIPDPEVIAAPAPGGDPGAGDTRALPLADLDRLKVGELRQLAAEQGLPSDGNRTDLLNRLGG